MMPLHRNRNTKTTNMGYLPYKKRLPLPKTSQTIIKKPGNHNIKGFGVIDQNKLQQSCDGMMVLPIKIKSYQSMEITEADYNFCKKIGMESFMMDKKGNQVPVDADLAFLAALCYNKDKAVRQEES